MKLTVYNDTDKDWEMLANSEKGTHGEQRIPSHSMVNFEVAESHTREVFIRVWEDTVHVRVGPDLRSRLGVLPSIQKIPINGTARRRHFTGKG